MFSYYYLVQFSFDSSNPNVYHMSYSDESCIKDNATTFVWDCDVT